MKKTILALLVTLASAAIANAQVTTTPQSYRNDRSTDQSTLEDELNLTDDDLISIAELHPNIRAQLQNQSYVGWVIKNAWRKKKEGKTFYAVELEEGSDLRIATFDSWGDLIPERSGPIDQLNRPKHQ